jgi:hypothetical protein
MCCSVWHRHAGGYLLISTMVALWRRPKGRAHLEHLNADEGVEGLFEFGWNFPVIKKMDPDAAFEACCLNSFFCKCFLFHR